MAAPKKPTRQAAWLTKQAMADAIDVTVGYFDREVRRHAQPQHVRRDGRRLLFYARGVLDTWYEARLRPESPVSEFNELDFLIAMSEADPSEWREV